MESEVWRAKDEKVLRLLVFIPFLVHSSARFDGRLEKYSNDKNGENEKLKFFFFFLWGLLYCMNNQRGYLFDKL